MVAAGMLSTDGSPTQEADGPTTAVAKLARLAASCSQRRRPPGSRRHDARGSAASGHPRPRTLLRRGEAATVARLPGIAVVIHRDVEADDDFVRPPRSRQALFPVPPQFPNGRPNMASVLRFLNQGPARAVDSGAGAAPGSGSNSGSGWSSGSSQARFGTRTRAPAQKRSREQVQVKRGHPNFPSNGSGLLLEGDNTKSQDVELTIAIGYSTRRDPTHSRGCG